MTIGPELDIFEKFGMDLTDNQKERILDVANTALVASGGRVGLIELLYFLSTSQPPDHSMLGCSCTLEARKDA